MWRALDSDLVICVIYPVLLINTPCSEYPFKALRMRKRSQEEEKGDDGLLERYVDRRGKKGSTGRGEVVL